jgi:hypothetical protein
LPEWKGLTIQLWVYDLDAATSWYERLLERHPRVSPCTDVKEWELTPDTHLQISASKEKGQVSRLRLGVKSLERERKRLVKELDIEIDGLGKEEGESAWCNFDDPWGNRIGIYQDLRRAS